MKETEDRRQKEIVFIKHYMSASITVLELKKILDNHADVQLVDVREAEEHEDFNIGGELIPLSLVIQQIEKINRDKPVILYCRKGIRSQLAIQRLQDKFPFHNLVNLVGGTEAWKKEFGV